MRFSAPTPVMSRPVRVCAVQYALRAVSSFEEFARFVESYVDIGDDYDADLIVFPELLGAQLLGLDYLVDTSGHPWLLEVNGTPSLAVEHSDPAVERLIHEQKVRGWVFAFVSVSASSCVCLCA